LPKAETTWRTLLKDSNLMAESNDLSLLSSTGPKRRGDQSQKSHQKWTHCGNDDDLTNRAKTCIFNPDGIFGIHSVALHFNAESHQHKAGGTIRAHRRGENGPSHPN
jgi:hypothetical protein